MTLAEASKALMLIVAARPEYQNLDLTMTAGMWAKLFHAETFPQIEAAIARVLLTTKKGFPNPAEIREALDDLRRAAQGERAAPTAEEAWEEARRKCDIYRPAVWSHPYIEQAVAVIGARTIATSDENDRAIRAHFFRIYDAQTARRQGDQVNAQAIASLGVKINILGQGGAECVAISETTGRRSGHDPQDTQHGARHARASIQERTRQG